MLNKNVPWYQNRYFDPDTDEIRVDQLLFDKLDFLNISEHLFTKDMDVFHRFFEKLYYMDKDALKLLFGAENHRYDSEKLLFAENYYKKRGESLWENN